MSDDRPASSTAVEVSGKVGTSDAVPPEDIEQVLFYGNLETLTVAQRNNYLVKLCKHLGISPMTKPFDMIPLNGKLTVYANKGAAAQLQDSRKIGLTVLYAGPLRMGKQADGSYLYNNDIYVVDVLTDDPTGRASSNVGAVSIKGLSGEALANAIMKCHTKASRRAVLQHTGLGFPDESELDSIPRHAVATVEAGVPRILPASEAPKKF